MSTTAEILRQVVEQYVGLASLVRQLIATKSEDVATIESLTAQIADRDAEIASLVSSQSESVDLAQQLSNELTALVAEATAAIPQPVE